MLALANGQVAATAGTILAGSTLLAEGRVDACFTNVGGAPETLVVTVKRNGGTARRVARFVLQANETAYVCGFVMEPSDTLLAATSNATSVDYTVDLSTGGPLRIFSCDANGAERSGAAAIGSGSLTITGDLTVSGGDIDAGASGTAGTVDIFPSTASKGKIQIAAVANTNDDALTITNAAMGQATTVTIPDPGGAASFVMTAGAQTLAGVKTFTSVPVVNPATGTAGGIDLKSTTDSTGTLRIVAADSAGDTITTITHASQATTRTYTIPDALANAQFILGTQAAVARTATADGLTTGTIADAGRLQHITVTSADANHIVVLPTPTPGTIIVLDVGATGFELRSSTPASIAINGGTGANAESAIAANSTCVMICVSATAWKGFFMDADGDLAKVEAAA